MEIFLFWFICAVIIGIIAAKRQRSGFLYFLLAMLFSPLLIGILVLVLGNAKPTPTSESVAATVAAHNDQGDQIRCPECRELVRSDARKCKHCGTSLVSKDPVVLNNTPAQLPRNW
jgi:tRNA(Ile2) C34 agmatinyltransferase TiaS